MNQRITEGALSIDAALHAFVNQQVLPGTAVTPAAFWQGLERIHGEFAPTNESLLRQRDELQARIDAWWLQRRGQPVDLQAHRQFLSDIGYLQPEPATFQISTENVDAEIAEVAGPQLVVPLSNPRYALNAANARWGSLYDALYGTDAVLPPVTASGYDAQRGGKVIAFARRLLDEVAPLAAGRHADAVGYRIEHDELRVDVAGGLVTSLADAGLLAGWQGEATAPTAILLRHHGLHVQLCIDRNHPIGGQDPAGVSDVLLESALTTIQDCEDSVASVNAAEKIQVYGHWLGLMKGDLQASFLKEGRERVRRLNEDRRYHAPGGGERVLPGRSLMLVRNVGHHMRSDAVLHDGQPVFETVLDALITVTIALHDLRGAQRNSRTGSVYVVKPKMHGPEEVALANRLFTAVEATLGLPTNTVKLGIMDEERRTSANLRACIQQVRERVVFINTGFLDRTGDEIHTSMEAAAVLPKEVIKQQPWLSAYEKRNVEAGLLCGFRGRAQIGKGMWAMPDRMAQMLSTKGAHPRAAANTAWVPSPTAATLHALHYHQVEVAQLQQQLQSRLAETGPTGLDELLTPPLADKDVSAEDVQAELDNNIQGILGYVVRWIDQGVGCSKVPDIHGVGLMEDRATLRISSQHVANWLHHGVCSEAQVQETFLRMAAVVDQQNAGDPAYRPMASNPQGSLAFQAALELVFAGRIQPNGYTEFILHRYRQQLLAAQVG